MGDSGFDILVCRILSLVLVSDMASGYILLYVPDPQSL